MKRIFAAIMIILSLAANAHDEVQICYSTGKVTTCFQAGTDLEEATVAAVREFSKMNREYKLSIDRYCRKITVTLPVPVEDAITINVERPRQLQYSY